MATPPGSLELHQKLVDGIGVSALLDQFVAEVDKTLKYQLVF